VHNIVNTTFEAILHMHELTWFEFQSCPPVHNTHAHTDTYSASYSSDAHSALPDPTGMIPIGVVMAFSQSGRSIIPLTTYMHTTQGYWVKTSTKCTPVHTQDFVMLSYCYTTVLLVVTNY